MGEKRYLNEDEKVGEGADLKRIVVLDMRNVRCPQRLHHGSRWINGCTVRFYLKKSWLLKREKQNKTESPHSSPLSFSKHFQFHYLFPFNFMTKIPVCMGGKVGVGRGGCYFFMWKVGMYSGVCCSVNVLYLSTQRGGSGLGAWVTLKGISQSKRAG